jgi:hypothetical protein
MRILVASILLLVALPAVAADRCAPLLPESLVQQISDSFPEYRAPRESDNLSEDVKYNSEHGGSGCLGVAKGDYDADGRPDFAVGLSQIGGHGAVIVVALSRADHWELHKLDSWPDYRNRLFVDTEKAGTFERVGSAEGPLGKGELEHLRCPHDSVVFGATESTGVVYCFRNGRWLHTWVSD